MIFGCPGSFGADARLDDNLGKKLRSVSSNGICGLKGHAWCLTQFEAW
jgi:hypothetical protein